MTESLKGGEKGNEESAAEIISSASKHEKLGQVPAALELDIFFSEDYFCANVKTHASHKTVFGFPAEPGVRSASGNLEQGFGQAQGIQAGCLSRVELV